MGFNSGFKGLIYLLLIYLILSVNQTSAFWEFGQCRIYFTRYGRIHGVL